VEIDKLPFGRVAEFDEKHFPASRAEFLVRWLRQPDSLSLAVMEKDQIRGYGMIRLCREGFKIGPLFALDLKSAEELLDSLLGYAPRNANVYFDVPEPNKEALALTEKYGMKKVFETARMYTMGVPNINLNHVYGVTTFELG
jgi:hypothetical protein